MVATLEINRIDRRYEGLRLKDERLERRLLSSIAERGIESPLQGVPNVSDPSGGILLDGFKRLRCARKIGLTIIPWGTLGEDEVSGIVGIIARSNAHSLHLLEQARCIDELKRRFGMGVVQIATRLDRSTGWVGMRLGLLSEMRPAIREAVFSGKFPARSYLYTVRHFTRVKKVSLREADEFVCAVGGHSLSTREIDLLARGYFEGSAQLKEQIRSGRLDWSLEQLKAVPGRDDVGVDLSEVEVSVLRDLEIASRSLGRLRIKGPSVVDRENPVKTGGKAGSPAFWASAELGCSGLLKHWDASQKTIEGLYARCRETKSRMVSFSARQGKEGDRPFTRDRHQDGQAVHQA